MAALTYLDFDLQIERAAQGYRVEVNGPGGQAGGSFSLPFSDLELENFLLKIGHARRTMRRVDAPEVTAAKTIGTQLFDAVFANDLRACLRSSLDEASRQGAGLRIRLHLTNTPELADLPWEYLYHSANNRFLALSTGTPVVRYLELPDRIRPLAVTPPLRMLVMISSPRSYPPLDVEREWSKLQTALGDLSGRGLVVLERIPATLTELQQRLRRNTYHIVHFIGHGGFDERTQDGVLLLEDDEGESDRVSGQDLGTLLHDHHTLRLVLLNACEGARGSRTDPFAGTAQSLVQQGIPAVIAMQFEVSDEAAIALAREFYSAVADSYPVDAALAEARKALFAAGNRVEWGTPVLYLRAPDGKIFDVAPVPAQSVPAQPVVAPPAQPASSVAAVTTPANADDHSPVSSPTVSSQRLAPTQASEQVAQPLPANASSTPHAPEQDHPYHRATRQASEGDWAGATATLSAVPEAARTEGMAALLARAGVELKGTAETAKQGWSDAQAIPSPRPSATPEIASRKAHWPLASSWLFLSGWVIIHAVSVVAIIAGFFVVVNTINSSAFVRWSLIGALAGGVVGVAQWLILRQYVDWAWQWSLATAASLAIAGAILGITIQDDPGYGLLSLLIVPGIPQWFVLRRKINRSGWWPLIWIMGVVISTTSIVEIADMGLKGLSYSVVAIIGALIGASTGWYLSRRLPAHAGQQSSLTVAFTLSSRLLHPHTLFEIGLTLVILAITIALASYTGAQNWMWTSELSYPISFLVHENMAYIQYETAHGNDRLYAVNGRSGQTGWMFNGPSRLSNLIVADDSTLDSNLYVTSENNLYSLSSTTGEQLWQVHQEDGLGSLAAAEGTVYVTSSTHLYALDARDGQQKWSTSLNRCCLSHFDAPIVVNGVVYVMNNENVLYAIDGLTGQQKLMTPIKNLGDISSLDISNGFIYILQTSHISNTLSTTLLAIDIASGEQKWEYHEGLYKDSSFRVADGMVYVTSDYLLYALDENTGKQRWDAPLEGYKNKSIPIIDGHVVYVNDSGTLIAINSITGGELWRFRNEQKDGIERFLVNNGILFVEGNNDYVYAIDSTTGKQKWTFSQMENIRSMRLNNDTLYILTGRHLYALNALR